MKKNCTTCTRVHDSKECEECQASATDFDEYPMWKGNEDVFLGAVEKYREKIDRSPDHLYRHAAHAMLDELVELYNAQKKPA